MTRPAGGSPHEGTLQPMARAARRASAREGARLKRARSSAVTRPVTDFCGHRPLLGAFIPPNPVPLTGGGRRQAGLFGAFVGAVRRLVAQSSDQPGGRWAPRTNRPGGAARYQSGTVFLWVPTTLSVPCRTIMRHDVG
eukprot:scaffold7404_cov363-Prasinococcus_capsulatus_cf.AAC.1